MKIWQKIMIFSAMLILMLVPDAYAEDSASVSIERVSGGVREIVYEEVREDGMLLVDLPFEVAMDWSDMDDEPVYITPVTDEEILADLEAFSLSDSDFSYLFIYITPTSSDITYYGFLAWYSNEVFPNVNFSEINFDIIPLSETLENEDEVSVLTENENTVPENSGHTSDVSADISLMYNDMYYENVLLQGNTLTVPFSLTNSGDEAIEAELYFAEYDSEGKLTDFTKSLAVSVPAEETVSSNLSKEINAETVSAKIFLWKKDSMHPITDQIVVNAQKSDFYGNIFATAGKIDIDKPFCGSIDTNSDIDVVKFTPSVSGVYSMQLNAEGDAICQLYDNNLSLVNSVAHTDDKNYILCSLTANQNYYIRISGTAESSYLVSLTTPDSIVDISKNEGISDSLSDNTDFNIYKFVPEADGEYIFTAVDGFGVRADLYNNSAEKIISSDESDSFVSFRITAELIAGQEYYAVVYPKDEAEEYDYTIYVEEPFALISVE